MKEHKAFHSFLVNCSESANAPGYIAGTKVLDLDDAAKSPSGIMLDMYSPLWITYSFYAARLKGYGSSMQLLVKGKWDRNGQSSQPAISSAGGTVSWISETQLLSYAHVCGSSWRSHDQRALKALPQSPPEAKPDPAEEE